MPTVVAISDTHGNVTGSVLEAVRAEAPELIVHAGDSGGDYAIQQLETIAPVLAVAGNTDQLGERPMSAAATVGEVDLYVIHDIDALDLEPSSVDIGLVVFGHTHVGSVWRRRGVLYVNPGTPVAGKARHGAGASMAVIHIEGKEARAEIRGL